jgi:CheY-like chemotaxis protein
LAIDVSVADEVHRLVIDSAKLKQVLYNYLSNAIKFTENGGHITVRARPEDERRFRLEVEDDGIGIMPDEIGKLFVAFQQLDSGAAKRHQGTGLGLALSKKIVEAQGGQVGVQSTRGQGSVFYAVLPTQADLTNEQPPEHSTAPAASPDMPKVLVIEDSEADRKWLARILADAGYRVEIAKNGAEAIERARNQPFSAILLDLILPDTGGWDILHTIRAAGLNQNTPVIVVTLVAEKGIAKGFPIQDYLVKPVRPNDLLDSLRGAGLTPKSLQRRILVVDDDVKILKLASVGLKASGYEAVCHSSAVSALHDAELIEFAAVVLDLLMPEMDGFEFIDRFRRMDNCRHTPVIIWTNKDLTATDLGRLKDAAQSVALKSRDGIDTVLKELARHAPAMNGGVGTYPGGRDAAIV